MNVWIIKNNYTNKLKIFIQTTSDAYYSTL